MGENIMIFSWPFVFLILPLPFLIYLFLPPSLLNQSAALKVPDLNDFNGFQKQKNGSFFLSKLLMPFLIWVLLVTAAARPELADDLKEIPKSGRDLMLAVDLSGSMQSQDFEINGKFVDRLSASKWIASDFLKRRQGDRIGLILFGSHAYLQTPLTFDIPTVRQLLMEAEVGLAGNETAIGDAIALAVKQLKNSDQKSRVLILLTDGNNNAGELTPEKAADIASHMGLKIYTVAIGSKGRASLFNSILNYTEIDEKALQTIAEKTGGHYFRAYNTQELMQIYKKIEQLEPVEKGSEYYRPMRAVYYWPLLAALSLLALFICKVSFWRRKCIS